MADDAQLVGLPTELLLKITRHLTTTDLGNVRLTCKALEVALFNFFAHEFFRKKQFMISTFSLQALIDISNHPALGPVLKHVIIATDQVILNQNPDPMTPELSQFVSNYFAEEKSLRLGGARDMLAQAFKNLVNLETVDIRDFNSPSRRGRDGPQASWNSYGSQTLRDTLDRWGHVWQNWHLRMGGTHQVVPISPNDLFLMVTAALAESSARPKSIEVIVRDQRAGLEPTAMVILPHQEHLFAPLLLGLEKLHLDVQLPFGYFKDLQIFLSRTENLKWLRLNFRNCLYEHSTSLLEWLAQPCDAAQVPTLTAGQGYSPAPFAHLETLDLGHLLIDKDLLLKVIKKFPNLNTLSFWTICIQSQSRRDDEDALNWWAEVFWRLESHQGLREISIGRLTQLHHSTDLRMTVDFTDDSDPSGKKRTDRKSYVGLSADKFLNTLSKDAKVRWPLLPGGDLSDSDAAEDDGDEDGDEDHEDSDQVMESDSDSEDDVGDAVNQALGA